MLSVWRCTTKASSKSLLCCTYKGPNFTTWSVACWPSYQHTIPSKCSMSQSSLLPLTSIASTKYWACRQCTLRSACTQGELHALFSDAFGKLFAAPEMLENVMCQVLLDILGEFNQMMGGPLNARMERVAVWVKVKYWVSSTTQTQHQKDKERVVVCLHGTGQELHWRGYYTKGIDAAKGQRFLWLAEAKKDN